MVKHLSGNQYTRLDVYYRILSVILCLSYRGYVEETSRVFKSLEMNTRCVPISRTDT